MISILKYTLIKFYLREPSRWTLDIEEIPPDVQMHYTVMRCFSFSLAYNVAPDCTVRTNILSIMCVRSVDATLCYTELILERIVFSINFEGIIANRANHILFAVSNFPSVQSIL